MGHKFHLPAGQRPASETDALKMFRDRGVKVPRGTRAIVWWTASRGEPVVVHMTTTPKTNLEKLRAITK